MSEWIDLIAADQIAEAQGKSVKGPNGHMYAVFKHNGELRVLDDECCHQGGPLGEGDIDGEGVVTCPWHGWQFNSENGECMDVPGECVRKYNARIEDGKVRVELPG